MKRRTGGLEGGLAMEQAEEKNAIAGFQERAFDNFMGEEMEPPRTAEPPPPPPVNSPSPKIRTNLKETVFFMPNLKTDEDGNIILKFTMNEALTKWRFMGFALTKDLKFAFTENEVRTQKDLMVMPNAPRFFRENDRIVLTAKVSNLSDKNINGNAILKLFDATNRKSIDNLFKNTSPNISFKTKPGQSDLLAWDLKVPDGKVPAVAFQVIAQSDKFSDGEENIVPVLTDRILVTETKPLAVRGKEKKDFVFEGLKKSGQSSTLKNHSLKLEFTSNPAWYAVQSLPYLMEYPHECTEQIFNKYYANTLASSVANKHPKIKNVFEKWKNIDSDALKSNLSKNAELKSALLEETPWVLAAQNEEIQKKNIGLLFDLNRMAKESKQIFAKLEQRQSSNGGFSWFPGGQPGRYITQYLVESMGHLQHLGIDLPNSTLLNKAVKFCDAQALEEYQKLLKLVRENKTKLSDDHLSRNMIHYLYARSFYTIKMNDSVKEMWEYYINQSKTYWLGKGIYAEGMIALALHRAGDKKPAIAIVESLKERSFTHEELGIYWKFNYGYFWYQLPIETQAMMIEVFGEVTQDAQAVDDMKLWLLKNKQTTHWKTTKATAAAVYALLMNGDNWLEDDQEVEISLGGQKLDQSKFQKEPGTGYFKTEFPTEKIQADMGNISINNPNNVPAWGAMYWQYFEQMDKVDIFEETPLKIKKELYKEINSDKGPVLKSIKETKIHPGDKLIVRIEIRADRPMEYLHLKDLRASGLEPINVLSRYKWQGGLGYYESTKDLATHFFISYIPQGTYVFEYPLRANHKGDFSNGITTMQCMYAPEFSSHSEGMRILIE